MSRSTLLLSFLVLTACSNPNEVCKNFAVNEDIEGVWVSANFTLTIRSGNYRVCDTIRCQSGSTSEDRSKSFVWLERFYAGPVGSRFANAIYLSEQDFQAQTSAWEPIGRTEDLRFQLDAKNRKICASSPTSRFGSRERGEIFVKLTD